MDFTSMNLGDLLFALNCDRLKNEIRKIEKINKRIVQSKNGIYFNEIYIYIYIYVATLSGRIGKVVASRAEVASSIPVELRLHRCILCTRRSGGTAHEGGV